MVVSCAVSSLICVKASSRARASGDSAGWDCSVVADVGVEAGAA